jgi:hypothetical protein
MTSEGTSIDLTKTCPRTLRTLLRRDVEVKLRVEMARKDADIQGWGPLERPWLAPLKELMNSRSTSQWTDKHKSLLRARVANGLYPPSVFGRNDDAKLCKVCGVLCTQEHRDFHCPPRYWERRQFGLPTRLLDSAMNDGTKPLWKRSLVVDPTIAFPPPSLTPPKWTIAEDPANPAFSSDAYGDGSRIQLCGAGTERAALGIVQLGGDKKHPHVVNCLIAPLAYVIQDVPPAELSAFVLYVQNAIDDRPLTFFTDCEWVLNGFQGGEYATTQACHVYADLWSDLWTCWKKRGHKVDVKKVKAHTKAACLSLGSAEFIHREGNSSADAAAKKGLEMHQVNIPQVDQARRLRAMVQAVAKFLVHMQIVVSNAGDDAEKLDRKKRAAERKAARIKAADLRQKTLRHAPLQGPAGVRCLWCNRRAVSDMGLNRLKCVQAPGHFLWKSGDLVMCRKCGCYSESRTHGLKDFCSAKPDVFARLRRHRFFVLHVHPTKETPMAPPEFWWRAASSQMPVVNPDDPRAKKTMNNSQASDWECTDSLARLTGPACRSFKPFAWPEPDEPRFSEAVCPQDYPDLDDDNDTQHAPLAPAASSTACIGVSRTGTDHLASVIRTGARNRGRFQLHSERPEPLYDVPRLKKTRYVMRDDDPCHPRFDISHDDSRQSDKVLSVARKAYAIGLELLDTIHITGGECCQGEVSHDLGVIQNAFQAADDLADAYRSAYGPGPAGTIELHDEDTSVEDEAMGTYELSDDSDSGLSLDPRHICRSSQSPTTGVEFCEGDEDIDEEFAPLFGDEDVDEDSDSGLSLRSREMDSQTIATGCNDGDQRLDNDDTCPMDSLFDMDDYDEVPVSVASEHDEQRSDESCRRAQEQRELLEDLLDLEECGQRVSWPVGYDARTAAAALWGDSF